MNLTFITLITWYVKKVPPLHFRSRKFTSATRRKTGFADRNRSSVPLQGVDLAIGKEDGLGTYQQFIYLPFQQKEMVVLIQALKQAFVVCEHVCSWHLVDSKPAQNPKKILIPTLFYRGRINKCVGEGGGVGEYKSQVGLCPPPPPHTHTLLDRPSVIFCMLDNFTFIYWYFPSLDNLKI